MTKVGRYHITIARAAANEIREYWRTHPHARLFHKPDVRVCPDTGIITSDLRPDGYPPRR